MSVLQKWATCLYGLAFGHGGEDGHALREEGINEGYGCDNQNIVNSEKFEKVTIGGPVAKLYGTGKFADPKVIAALEESCGNCRFWRSR